MPNETGYWNPPFPSGGGTIATITFNASGSVEGASMLILRWTGLFDVDMNEIPHDVFHGQVELLLKVRDIAVILVEPSWTEIYETWSTNITVVVLNEGDVNATFTVTCRYNLDSSYGDIGTVAVVVNMIPKVLNAKAGLVTMKDLSLPSAITEDVRIYLNWKRRYNFLHNQLRE